MFGSLQAYAKEAMKTLVRFYSILHSAVSVAQ